MKQKLTSILVAVCLLACCITAPVSADTKEELEADYEIVDKAYDEMIKIAPIRDIRNAYVKAKKSGLRYRDELPKGFMTYKHGYYDRAYKAGMSALDEVEHYMKFNPEKTILLEKAVDAYEKLDEFGGKHNPIWIRPIYAFEDLEE